MKKVKDVNTIEIVSKKRYERLLRSHDRITQRVEDLEDTVKLMRYQDTCLKGFIFNYMKLRYRPKLSEDEEKELYSEDGRHWYPIHGLTLEPVGFTRYRFDKRLIKMQEGFSPFGYMGYNKTMDNNRYWKLEGLAEKVAGRKNPMNFSDPKEDEEFDRICRNMA